MLQSVALGTSALSCARECATLSERTHAGSHLDLGHRAALPEGGPQRVVNKDAESLAEGNHLV